MAVYTKLTFEEISNHLKNYKIGELLDFKEIVAGIDNSNFIIETSQDKFILTIFEKRIKPQDLPFFIDFKLHLAKNGVSCPKPVLSVLGASVADLKGKKSAIVSFLSGKTLQPREDGYYDNISLKHCAEIGKVLAKMHVGASDFKGFRKNDLSFDGFGALFAKFSSSLDDNLRAEIDDVINFVKKGWNHNLPAFACHLDLFPDNVFFDENQNLTGVIDFYFAANDLLIYDFASCVNAWCFDENNIFVQEKFDAMIESYQEIRKFSQEELEFINFASMAASLRFLLTRLHDKIFTPKDSLVNVKDPKEYLQKMRYFKGLIDEN